MDDALRRAAEVGLDLVEVAPDARPPVCRIFDYRKILYEQRRRQKEARKKTHHIDVKEIKVRVTIDPHDLEVKARKAREFLDEGHKIKLTIQYRGREITKQDLGTHVIQRFLGGLTDIVEIEQALTRQGRQQHMMLARRRDYVKKPVADESKAAPEQPAAAT